MQTIGYTAIAALAGAMLLYGATLPDTHWWRRMLSWRVLTTYGVLCYGLYLLHYPIAWGLKQAAPTPLVLVLLLPGSLALAWLSWRYVERPMLEARAHPARVVTTARTDGTPSRQ